MIKTTLRTLLESAPALNIFAAQPVPMLVSFRVGKIVNEVGRELRAYDEARLAACARYGTPNEGTGHYDIPDEKRGDFDAELKHLLDAEVEVAGEPVALSLVEGVKVPPAVAAQLMWLFAEERAGVP